MMTISEFHTEHDAENVDFDGVWVCYFRLIFQEDKDGTFVKHLN